MNRLAVTIKLSTESANQTTIGDTVGRTEAISVDQTRLAAKEGNDSKPVLIVRVYQKYPLGPSCKQQSR